MSTRELTSLAMIRGKENHAHVEVATISIFLCASTNVVDLFVSSSTSRSIPHSPKFHTPDLGRILPAFRRGSPKLVSQQPLCGGPSLLSCRFVFF